MQSTIVRALQRQRDFARAASENERINLTALISVYAGGMKLHRRHFLRAAAACAAASVLPRRAARADAAPVTLGNDLVVAALIARPGAPIDKIIAKAERGELKLVVLDLSLFCAVSAVKPKDKVDWPRFARLLQFAEIQPSLSRGPHGLEPPTVEEIAHWRDVVFGRD